MASNKVATVVLLDVGSSVTTLCGSETFFKKCQWCLLRMIQRKIFSCENDEIGIVLFGSEETESNLYHTSDDDSLYQNIQEFTTMQKSDWTLYEQVQGLKTTTVTNSNWIEGLSVSLDYLKEQTRGKRFRDKQLIVLSNFAMKLKNCEYRIDLLAGSIDSDNIKLIVMGVDLEEECKDKILDTQLPGSLGLMFSLIDKVENGVSLSFMEAEDDIKFYERKGKLSRFSKVDLRIGSKISIPIRWIKITLEPTRLSWIRKPVEVRKPVDEVRKPAGVSADRDKISEREISYVMEVQKLTKFGDTQIVLNYADMEAMDRKTGPASCILIGCVKRQRISRKMFISKDLYAAVPEKNAHAQAMISAFIDALIEADKYALVRRITTNNGKVKIGVLIPVSDEVGKMFYFLQLPFAQYELVVPDVILPEPNNKEILDIFDNLIDLMTIPDKAKSVPMKDPVFQLRCHVLHLCGTGQLPKDPDNNTPIPDYIQQLCDPYPELIENALPYIEKLEEILPIEVDEQALESNKNKKSISSKDAENMFKEPDSHSKIFINNPELLIKEEDMDWENVETQEWPDELKEKFRQPTGEVPPIILNEEMLSRNKYDTNYVSDRLLKDHSAKEKKVSALNQDEESIYNSEIQEMLEQRQDTEVDVDTDETMQRLRARLENK